MYVYVVYGVHEASGESGQMRNNNTTAIDDMFPGKTLTVFFSLNDYQFELERLNK